MCKIPTSTSNARHDAPDIHTPHAKAAFKARRLTATTFVITEYMDIYHEQPLIYVKRAPDAGVILILDTGCGGATADPDVEVRSLREYIETVPIPDNQDEPLNKDGEMRYIVVLSHCHYDHICAYIHHAPLHFINTFQWAWSTSRKTR